ncbi:hypothetical protein [Absidia glauca]|uniref:Uncharacterized protein n=1 Tax=Absidia glauca TaxID=4829 RepID=A0A168RSG4_ABSGL|nr:hypothetical protein [Absidia glauca]
MVQKVNVSRGKQKMDKVSGFALGAVPMLMEGKKVLEKQRRSKELGNSVVSVECNGYTPLGLGNSPSYWHERTWFCHPLQHRERYIYLQSDVYHWDLQADQNDVCPSAILGYHYIPGLTRRHLGALYTGT